MCEDVGWTKNSQVPISRVLRIVHYTLYPCVHVPCCIYNTCPLTTPCIIDYYKYYQLKECISTTWHQPHSQNVHSPNKFASIYDVCCNKEWGFGNVCQHPTYVVTLIFMLFTCNKHDCLLRSLLNTNQIDLLLQLESKLNLISMQPYVGPHMMSASLDVSHHIPLHSWSKPKN